MDCGNCDCADRSQCKKGNSYGFVITESYISTEKAMEVAPAAEHDGKCKCGTNCPCVDCTCGH